jgi:hypothetical protein
MSKGKIDKCLKKHKIEIVGEKKIEIIDKNKNETYCDRFIDEYTENGKIDRKDYNGLTTNRQINILKMSKEQIDICLKKYGVKIVDKNKKLFEFIKNNHIKYFILSSENNNQINSLRSSNSKYVNDLNLQQDIYDERFIFRFGNGVKINGASTIINDDAKFWWGEEAPYMKEISELGKNNSNKILDFITEKINGLTRSDIQQYRKGVVENIFLNRYYPILFTTNREYFDNFIVIRKNNIDNKINVNVNVNKNGELNSFFNQIFNGIKVVKNENTKQFIINEGIAVKVPVNINKNCPGSMVGIENKNINSGGKVYCYLNSLMQMLYCMDELRNNTFLNPVFRLLSGKDIFINAEKIIPIYQKMYPTNTTKQNILKFNDPTEFLGFTFNNMKNTNINNIIIYNSNLNSFYFGFSNINNSINKNIDYKKYLFINIDKMKNNGTIISFDANGTNTKNFINTAVDVKKELNINSKKYKLLGSIFVLSGPHYTFASYDDKGNVCRYYDDKKIFKEIQNNITLGNNGKLLLYKEYKDK